MKYKFKEFNKCSKFYSFIITDNGHTMTAEDIVRKLNSVVNLEKQTKKILDVLAYVYDERIRGVDNGLTDRLIKDTIEQGTGMNIKDVLKSI